jgi:hypothetical protein
MKEYRTSLQKRRHRSAKLVDRYWSDPEFRLARINADRARRGRPLIQSLDEVAEGWSRQPVNGNAA